MAERINRGKADPVIILACRILDKLARREVDPLDPYCLVHAEPMNIRELYRAINHHRYGELWHQALALCIGKGAVTITDEKLKLGGRRIVVRLVRVPPRLVAHRKRRQKARRRRPQSEWFKLNVLHQAPSLEYVPGDPLAQR